MLKLEPARALPLRLAQIAQGWKLGFGRGTSLEQVQQRGDRGGSEPQ